MKRKWYSQTQYVDLETGELLSKSKIEREHYIKTGSSYEIKDCGAYLLKILTNEYRRNPQQRIQF